MAGTRNLGRDDKLALTSEGAEQETAEKKTHKEGLGDKIQHGISEVKDGVGNLLRRPSGKNLKDKREKKSKKKVGKVVAPELEEHKEEPAASKDKEVKKEKEAFTVNAEYAQFLLRLQRIILGAEKGDEEKFALDLDHQTRKKFTKVASEINDRLDNPKKQASVKRRLDQLEKKLLELREEKLKKAQEEADAAKRIAEERHEREKQQAAAVEANRKVLESARELAATEKPSSPLPAPKRADVVDANLLSEEKVRELIADLDSIINNRENALTASQRLKLVDQVDSNVAPEAFKFTEQQKAGLRKELEMIKALENNRSSPQELLTQKIVALGNSIKNYIAENVKKAKAEVDARAEQTKADLIDVKEIVDHAFPPMRRADEDKKEVSQAGNIQEAPPAKKKHSFSLFACLPCCGSREVKDEERSLLRKPR